MKRLISRAVGVALLLGLGACSQSPATAWTGPGWYLELPFPVVAGGPSVQGGPYSYDQCEGDRKNRSRPDRYICVRHTFKPAKSGMY